MILMHACRLRALFSIICLFLLAHFCSWLIAGPSLWVCFQRWLIVVPQLWVCFCTWLILGMLFTVAHCGPSLWAWFCTWLILGKLLTVAHWALIVGMVLYLAHRELKFKVAHLIHNDFGPLCEL